MLNRQLHHADRQFDRLVHQLAEAAPTADTDVSTEDEPASPTDLPDAAILLSLPGIGTRVLATLFAEGSDAVRRRDYDALRCLCGVAPVTRRSGKSLLVIQRRAAHDRLRDAVFYWSRVAVQRDPVSHGKYQPLRARGHGHARALRSVADRLLNVACAMLRDGTCFDAHRAGMVLPEPDLRAVAVGVRMALPAGRSSRVGCCRGPSSRRPRKAHARLRACALRGSRARDRGRDG